MLAQTTYLPLGTEEYYLLDRLETLNGELAGEFYSALKPIARKDAVAFLKEEHRMSQYQANNLSNIDRYNMRRALSISGEWSETADGDDGALPSRKPILKYFYQKQPDMVHVSTGDFFLAANPVLYAQAMKESSKDGIRYINTRGAEFRGRIFNKVGFYTMLADNQEKVPGYIEEWEQRHMAFPGVDYYTHKADNKPYDYLLARGYVDAGAFNDHLNVTFGYDKHFSGDGMRSLMLSDFGAPATFLRLRTRIWKLMYENLYLELTPDYLRGSDQRLPRKYASFHQLSINATRWLNVGIFESTIYAQEERFGAEYLVPVIFYNTLARSLGARQKTSLGLSFKALALQRLQFYGQGYFDQLKPGELGNGWWGNQFGIQLGAKYFNAFTLPNLDLQGEVNVVRPFTYSANDGVSNYTHYNQPLTHPYGAGFGEVIGSVRYQPVVNLFLSVKGIYSLRGTSDQEHNGTSIFVPYDSRSRDYDYSFLPGRNLQGLYLNFNAAYEVRPNIFLEAGATYLDRSYDNGLTVYPRSTAVYGGLRWNIARREYNYF